MELEIKRLTSDLAEDYFTFFEEVAYPEHTEWGRECYCCFFHASCKEEWDGRTGAQNRAVAGSLIQSGRMNGLLIYADGKPVGWCHFDGRQKLPGLKVFYPQVIGDDADACDDSGIASIVCFTIAQGYRRMGLAKALLQRACEELGSDGYAVAEAYPLSECDNDEHHYHGPLSLYLKQGFTAHRQVGEQTVVRKKLK